MTAQTDSEQLFEDFCVHSGIRLERVKVGGDPTPDYDIYLDDLKIVVEVKQIDPNAEEIEAEHQLEENGFAIVNGTPGHRVRKKITDAGPQIRARTQDKHPSMIVLFNNVSVADHAQPYNIRVGMYGLETIVLGVPQNFEVSPFVKDKKFDLGCQ